MVSQSAVESGGRLYTFESTQSRTHKWHKRVSEWETGMASPNNPKTAFFKWKYSHYFSLQACCPLPIYITRCCAKAAGRAPAGDNREQLIHCFTNDWWVDFSCHGKLSNAAHFIDSDWGIKTSVLQTRALTWSRTQAHFSFLFFLHCTELVQNRGMNRTVTSVYRYTPSVLIIHPQGRRNGSEGTGTSCPW